MKANLREIIHYIDESTLEKAKNEKVQKQESPSKVSKDVEESVDKMISNRMSKAYSEWKSNQDTQPFNEKYREGIPEAFGNTVSGTRGSAYEVL